MFSQFAQSLDEFLRAGVEGAVGEVGCCAFADVGIEVGKSQRLICRIVDLPVGLRLIEFDDTGGWLDQMILAHGHNYTASRRPAHHRIVRSATRRTPGGYP